MKSNELMIDDWVLDDTQKAQVTIITCVGGIATTVNKCSNNELLEPIPLTSEILENNGFEYINGEYGCWLMDKIELREREPYNGLFEVEIRISGKYMFLHYVHELQHVLRLCKIEKEIKL